jgi:hypothetical protein
MQSQVQVRGCRRPWIAAKRLSDTVGLKIKSGYAAAQGAYEANMADLSPDENSVLYGMQHDTSIGGGALFGVTLDRRQNDGELRA